MILAILFIASAYGGMADPANGTKFALIGMCFPIGLAATILLLATLLILRMWRMALIPIISIIISFYVGLDSAIISVIATNTTHFTYMSSAR